MVSAKNWQGQDTIGLLSVSPACDLLLPQLLSGAIELASAGTSATQESA
jgi:hypothetical protein